MRFRSAGWLVAAVSLVAGCGGSGNSGGGSGPQTKTTPTISAWPTASAITYGQTLASSTLSGGTASVSGSFAWTTSTTAPGAGTPSENVTFTPTDTTDYNTATGSVSVMVNPATPTVTAWPTASAITYGQTLASSMLTGGTASVTGTFVWIASTTAPGTGTTSENVTFKPSDATDYNTVNGPVNVTVNPATPTVSAWPTASAITYGQTLASSTLTGGTASVSGAFAWTTSTTAPGAGTPSESVTFTPSDATDYNTVKGPINIMVNKATPTVIAWPTASTINYGQTLASSTLSGGMASVSGTFAWTTPTTEPSAGTQSESVTFTPADAADNNTVTGSVSVTVNSTPAPTVVATVPTNGMTNVNVGNALTATFSVTMDSSTINTTTFTLATTSGGTPVAGLVSYNAATAIATFTPNAALVSNTSYTATITTGAKSSAGAPLASPYIWNFTTGAIPNQVTVDFGTTYQTIRGFGGSTAWLGQMPTAVATALFSPTSGLDLNILRVRIDPEGSPSSANPYETSEWDYEAANGREAVAANPKAIVFASPWTPPATWKLNGSSSLQDDGETWNQSFASSCGAEGTGYCGGYLDPNHYADYANYLEDFVSFFNTTNGFNLYAISMQNEPEENVTYESCVWTPEEMDTWVADNGSIITSDAYHTQLMMPESNNFNPVDAAKALSDPNAEGLINIVGGHIYQILFGGSITAYPPFPSADSPKELWMTEFGPLVTTTPTWAEAVTTYAESIHNSLVTGQYNAYVWWGIFGTPTAAGTWGLVDSSGNPTVIGEVMGQYSKFIQPGYVRVSATANPVAGVYVSAYSNSSPSHYVIVGINSNTTTENLTFVLNNGTVTSMTPYQSTSAAGLAAQAPVGVSSGQFSYMLPAQSIVTFVQ
jgi:O-glycosyl hydrolase